MASNNDFLINLVAGLNTSDLSQLKKDIETIENKLDIKLDISFDKVSSTDLEQQISKIKQQLQNSLKISTDIEIDKKNSVDKIKRESDAMLDVVQAASKAAQEKLEFAKANEKVADSARRTGDAIDGERAAMSNMDDIGSVLAGLNMTGRQGTSIFQQFGDTLQQAFMAFTAANLLQDAIYRVVDAGRESLETVKELNDAATSLRMATGDSYESVKGLMQQYNQLGQEIGAITTDVSDAADAWLRQGHSIDDTNTLIEDSMILSKVANLESADSTKYLTSAMQGYKVAVDDVLGVVDKLSAVDLESATDAGGLAEAMSRTAEGAQIAGVSMDRLLGMIATVGEVTQKSMSSIGESYKTIFSRMRNIKDGKLSMIGDDGEVEDISNVEVVLNTLGIKLRESNQEFRNFQDVLDDVASGWNTYSSVQQAAISKAFSGVRQQENFLVLMENWDKVQEYTNVSANSAGTATEKFGYYLDSLEAKTNSLVASLENLASQTISDELYASVLDTSKAVVDLTTESGILKATLMGLGTSGSIYAFTQLTGLIRNATQELANMSVAMDTVNAGNIGQNEMQRIIDLTGGLSRSQTRLLLSTQNLTDAQKMAILMNQGLTQAEAQQQIQTWGVATAQNGATSATITFSGALRGLWATLLANPLVLVTAAVTAGTMAFNAYKQSQEELARSTKEAAQNYGSAADSISDYADKYKTLRAELTDANTTEERQREIKQQLLSLQEELNAKYADEHEQVDLVTGSYEEQIGVLQQLNKEQAQRYLNENESGIRQAKSAMDSNQTYNLGVGIGGMYSDVGKDIIDIAGQFEEQGIQVNKDESTGTFNIVIKADAQDANKVINDFMTEIQGLKDKYGDDAGISDILTLSSESLNDSQDIIDKYGDSYEKSRLAEIAVNDQLSATYNRATEAVLAYNNAVVSGDDAEIEKTAEDLKSIKAEIDDSSEWDNYGDIISDVFSKATNDVQGFKQAVDDANRGAAGDTPNVDNSGLSDTINLLDDMSDKWKDVQSLYKEFSDNGVGNFSNDGLKSIIDTFSEIEGVDVDGFVATLADSASTADDVQAAFDRLATQYVNSTGCLENLTDATVDQVGRELEAQGIVNGSAIAHQYLAAQKYYDANASTELANNTLAEYSAFLNEAEGAGISQLALARLELAKIAVNNAKIDSSSDIDQVINLANAAGASANALGKLARAKSIYAAAEAGAAGGLAQLDLADEIVSGVGSGNFDYEFQKIDASQFKSAVYGGGGGGSSKKSGGSGGSGSSAKEKEPTVFDWMEQKVEVLDSQVDRLKDKIDILVGYKGKNNVTDTAIDKLTEKMQVLQQMYDRYMEQANGYDLSQDYIDKIQNGAIDIESVGDEDLKKKSMIIRHGGKRQKMSKTPLQIHRRKSRS